MPQTVPVRILDHNQIQAKLKRMAMEIRENMYPETSLIMVGIDQKGETLAQKLVNEIQKTGMLQVTLLRAIPVREHQASASLSIPGISEADCKGKVVIIVDDVLYSGRTLYLTLEAVMQHQPAKVQAAVLIDRGHRSFPVHADYTGLTLGTTLQEHIRVEELASGEMEAYLLP